MARRRRSRRIVTPSIQKVFDNQTNIVFCLPGNRFSDLFLQSWTELLIWCGRNNINPLTSYAYDSNVYYVRSRCLGASVDRGEYQIPFNGALKYDYIMWIDSDMVFHPSHLENLIELNTDVACGIYKTADHETYATVEKWDKDYYIKHGKFEFLTESRVRDIRAGVLPVEYSGMGWMLMKKGVIENIKYPWFAPVWQEFGNGMREFSSEDVAFCQRIREAGFEIKVDTSTVIGHEKSCVL
jgi:hypothetical protein